MNIFLSISILLGTVDAEAYCSNNDDSDNQKNKPEDAARLYSLATEFGVGKSIELSLSIIELCHLRETNPELVVSCINILRGSIKDNIVVLEKNVSDVPGVFILVYLVVVHDSQVARVFGIIKDLAIYHKIFLRDCELPVLIGVEEVDL